MYNDYRLKEALLDVLEPDECKQLGENLGADPRKELCAGKKKLFPKVKRFKRIYSKKKHAYWFKLSGLKTNYLSIKHRSKNYYYGGEGDCQGKLGTYFLLNPLSIKLVKHNL